MSIRLTFLFISILILFFYTWKDWFKSLCSLIVLMAFLEHPDMPKTIMGIKGFNPWNFLMAAVLLAWFIQRHREGFVLKLPRAAKILLWIYFLLIFISFLRMIAAPTGMYFRSARAILNMISENFINPFKFVIPGMLILYGCRTRNRVKLASIALLIMGFFLAIQVIRWIPAGYALRGDAEHRRLKLDREIGYHSVDLSTILAGTSWSMVAAVGFFRQRWAKALLLMSAAITVFGQALTGGRAGFLAWGTVGLILCLLKWRKYLIFIPVVIILFPIVLPGAAQRMLEGFVNIGGQSIVDNTLLTSGRSKLWPYVISEISKSPMIGYGRGAMGRTGLARQVVLETGEYFGHPHNAYLEWLLDNGMLGFIPLMLFYSVIIVYATKLFRNKSDPLYSAVGGLTLAFVLAQLVGAMGAQSFYPREGTVGMWCAIGLTLRLTAERLKVKAAAFNQHYQHHPYPTLPQVAIYSNPQ